MSRLSSEAYDQWLDSLLDSNDAHECTERLAQLAQVHPEDAEALAADLARIKRSQGFLEVTQVMAEQSGDNLPLLEKGTIVGAWRVLGLIGSGGMGIVFKVERADGEFRQVAALKLLNQLEGTSVMRFERERQLLAELNHPAIVRLVDGGTAQIQQRARPFLVTELIEGADLDDWVKSHRPNLSERLRIFTQVAEAISYAHNQLVVHRDIKPSNIRIDLVARAHLLDFGISRILNVADDASQTRTLTLNFGAPEQLLGGRISVQTDVYALGALLFWLLTEQPPLQLEKLPIREVIIQAQAARVPSLSAMQPAPGLRINALHADLDAICQQALAKAPQDRYSSVFAMLEDLRAYQESRPIRARKLNALQRGWRTLKRNWRSAAAATLILSSLISALVFSRMQTARTEVARLQAVEARNEAMAQSQANTIYKDLMIEAIQTNSGTALTPEMVLQRLQTRMLQSPSVEQNRILTGVLAELYAEQKNWQAVNILLQEALPKLAKGSIPADASLVPLRCLYAMSFAQLERHQQALELLRAVPDFLRPDQGAMQNLTCLNAYAHAHRGTGDLAEVKRVVEPAIAHCVQRQDCDAQSLSALYMSLGNAAFDLRDFALAQTAIAGSGEYLRKAGRQESSDYATWLNNSANNKAAIGLLGEAKAPLLEAITLRRRLSGDSAGLAKLLINHASHSCARVEPAEAISNLVEAESLIDRFAKGEATMLARLHLTRACAHAQLFEFEQARRQLQQSELAFRKLPQVNWIEWHDVGHEVQLQEALRNASVRDEAAWQAHLAGMNTEANRARPKQYLDVAEHAWFYGQWQAAHSAADTAYALYQKSSDPASLRLAQARLLQLAAQQCLGQVVSKDEIGQARALLAKQVSTKHWMLQTDLLLRCTPYLRRNSTREAAQS